MEQKEVIMMGDFNIDYNKKKEDGELKSIIALNGLKQLVKSATRITRESSTLIDIILSYRLRSLPRVIVAPMSFSDHDMICCIRKINTQNYPYRTIKCRNYANYNPVNLLNDVKNINRLPIFETSTDVNSAVLYFTKLNEWNALLITLPILQENYSQKLSLLRILFVVLQTNGF